MSRILFRYVVKTYFAYFAVIAISGLTIFLVADFVDRAKAYRGANWVIDVLVLYGYKALVAAQQLGPAMAMLAAGATISVLRKRGELTALKSLTVGPLALYVPVGLSALCLALFLAAFDEAIVVDAGRRVDDITVHRFNHWGDWRFHYARKQWFRIGNRVFYLRQANAEEGYVDATVLTLSPDFDLMERIDAARMVHVEGTRWELFGVLHRKFGKPGKSQLESYPSHIYDFGRGASGRAFQIREGRPEQMRLGVLRNQIGLRRNAGLPVRHFSLALHNRFAYPLTAVPAALLAVGIALRPGRRGHLMVAMVEGLAIAVALWGLMVVSKTLVMADRLNPGVAAWSPAVALAAAAAVMWLRREGKLGWKGI